jgi:hypothetical protein
VGGEEEGEGDTDASGDASSHHKDMEVNDDEDNDVREDGEGPDVPPGMTKNNRGEEDDKGDTDASGDTSSFQHENDCSDGYNPPYMRGTDNFAPPMGGNHLAARSSCDPGNTDASGDASSHHKDKGDTDASGDASSLQHEDDWSNGYDPPYMRGTDNFAPPMGGNHFAARSSCDPQGIKTIYLPKTVLALLQNPRAYKPDRKRCGTGTTLLVADTGATDHMLPDKSVFISYYPVIRRQVRMGNNLFAPILGYGTAIISLNGKKILVRDCLHIPDLRSPLYSLCAHQQQHGCGFIGMFGLGFHIFFPTFILEVDTAINCHLAYALVG